MPAGIEIYNADGSLQFDIGSRLFRSLSVQTTTGAAGSITIGGASPGGSITAFAVPVNDSDTELPVQVTVSGTTVSWTAGGVSKIFIVVY